MGDYEARPATHPKFGAAILEGQNHERNVQVCRPVTQADEPGVKSSNTTLQLSVGPG